VPVLLINSFSFFYSSSFDKVVKKSKSKKAAYNYRKIICIFKSPVFHYSSINNNKDKAKNTNVIKIPYIKNDKPIKFELEDTKNGDITLAVNQATANVLKNKDNESICLEFNLITKIVSLFKNLQEENYS